MAELVFERFMLALEATRGTAVTPPTHYLPVEGMMTPNQEVYRPVESRGTLAEFYRSKVIRKWTEWEGDGPLDVYNLPVLLNMCVNTNSTPTTPGGGTTTRLWTFTPNMTSDNVKSATLYWGDPNIQMFQAAYAMVDNFTISADASGTDGATFSLGGRAKTMAKVASPTAPAMLNGPLITGLNMELWMDTSSAIGTTAITGRFISAEFSVTSNRSYKFLASGPTADLSYSRTGSARRHGELRLVFELLDSTQYDLFQSGTVVKARVRMNGSLIEGSLYNYVEIDAYGPLDAASWGDLEGTNRTLELTIQTEYDTTAAADWSIKVQNNRTTL